MTAAEEITKGTKKKFQYQNLISEDQNFIRHELEWDGEGHKQLVNEQGRGYDDIINTPFVLLPVQTI